MQNHGQGKGLDSYRDGWAWGSHESRRKQRRRRFPSDGDRLRLLHGTRKRMGLTSGAGRTVAAVLTGGSTLGCAATTRRGDVSYFFFFYFNAFFCKSFLNEI